MKNPIITPFQINPIPNWISTIILICFFNVQLEAQQNDNWVEVSNRNSLLLLDVEAKHFPEYAGQLGLDGYDEKIRDFSPGFIERYQKIWRIL